MCKNIWWKHWVYYVKVQYTKIQKECAKIRHNVKMKKGHMWHKEGVLLKGAIAKNGEDFWQVQQQKLMTGIIVFSIQTCGLTFYTDVLSHYSPFWGEPRPENYMNTLEFCLDGTKINGENNT